MLLPSLYIKLGVIEKFLRAMDRKGCGFAFLQEKFPWKSVEKIKIGMFNGPQIRELMKDPIFDTAPSQAELSTRQSLKSIVTNFLGNHRVGEYEKEIEELLKSFRQLRARISVKLHFLQSHLDYFPNNCRDLSEELGECFHQDIHIMEER